MRIMKAVISLRQTFVVCDQELGAPNLADAIWLYGGDTETITETVTYSRFGVMPPWQQRLSEAQVRAVSLYIHSRGGKVSLQAIGEPSVKFESPLAVFEAALGHEQKITGDIHRLYGLAMEEKDYPSLSFLQWFIDEQVEEEEHVGQVVEDVKRVGDVSHALLMLDRELGQRQAEPAVEE